MQRQRVALDAIVEHQLRLRQVDLPLVRLVFLIVFTLEAGPVVGREFQRFATLEVDPPIDAGHRPAAPQFRERRNGAASLPWPDEEGDAGVQ